MPKVWPRSTRSQKTNQSSLEKWLNLGLSQEKYKISLEYCVITENKGVMKNRTQEPT